MERGETLTTKGPAETEVTGQPAQGVVHGTARNVGHASRTAWLRRGGTAGLAALYLLAWGLVALLPLNFTDLDAFFFAAARVAIGGHPFLIYSVRYQVVYPYANGPLSVAPMAVAAALARWVGWLDNLMLRRMLVMIVFALFSLLFCREALLAVERLRGQPLRLLPRLLAFGVCALSPQLWHSVLFYGHVEQPLLLWLVLAAVRALVERRPGRAGVLLGLALLTRTTALLALLPLLALTLRHRRWREALRLGGAAVGVLALGLLPFWLADRSDLTFSLVTFHAALPISGGNFWGIVPGSGLWKLALLHDSQIVVLAAILISAAAVILCPRLDVDARALYLLLALANMAFPLCIKTVWPYYFVEPYTYVIIWWLAGMPSVVRAERPTRGEWLRWCALLTLPAAFTLCAQIDEHGLTGPTTDAAIARWSLLSFGALLLVSAVLALLLVRGARGDTSRATASATASGAPA